MNTFFDDIIGWMKRPFDAQGSAVRWILFVGLLIIAAWFWHVILMDVVREG